MTPDSCHYHFYDYLVIATAFKVCSQLLLIQKASDTTCFDSILLASSWTPSPQIRLNSQVGHNGRSGKHHHPSGKRSTSYPPLEADDIAPPGLGPWRLCRKRGPYKGDRSVSDQGYSNKGRSAYVNMFAMGRMSVIMIFSNLGFGNSRRTIEQR